MTSKFVRHICILTKHYKETLRFYKDILGFELIEEFPIVKVQFTLKKYFAKVIFNFYVTYILLKVIYMLHFICGRWVFEKFCKSCEGKKGSYATAIGRCCGYYTPNGKLN